MRSFFCRRLLSLTLALCAGAPLANATSTTPPPAVRVYVLDALLAGLVDQQVFVVPAAPARPLAFGATVAREPGSPVMDVYLEVIVPGGRVFTWVPKPGGGSVLVEGLSPVARAFTGTSFATATVFGADAQYTFSEGHTPGMYSVFALLVPPGSDPGDARRWTWVNMVPLMFQGLTIQAISR